MPNVGLVAVYPIPLKGSFGGAAFPAEGTFLPKGSGGFGNYLRTLEEVHCAALGRDSMFG